VEMSDGLVGVLDRSMSMLMAKGRRKPGDARGRFPFRSWWFVQPRGVGLLFRCKRRNSSSITAGVDGGSAVVWCVGAKMATTTRWELGKTRFTWKGTRKLRMWDVADGFIIIETIVTIDAGLFWSCLFGKVKVKERAHAHADGDGDGDGMGPHRSFRSRSVGRIWGFED